MPGFVDRVINSYHILTGKEPLLPQSYTVVSEDFGAMYTRAWRDTTTAIMTPIVTRLSIDAAGLAIRHVDLNEVGEYETTKNSELNDRLSFSANVDQSGRDLIQNAVRVMLEEKVCALVPIETSLDPKLGTSYDILSMRVGTITEWFTHAVRVEVYNEKTGLREEIVLPKSYVAICYNPMFSVMDHTNTTLKRLIDKLALADASDNRMGSPNLDLILQLPYTVRTDSRKAEAKERRAAIEEQLYNSTYGVAYIDAAEKITQLNRPVANSLIETVDNLTLSLYNQLGLTQSVLDGTASSEELVAYYNRTIEPILASLLDGMIRSFLTKTARSQGQSIIAIPNLFKMAPIEILADAADKLTRNEIMSSNEVRAKLGLRPVKTKEASELRNKNINKAEPAGGEKAGNDPTNNKLEDK